MSNHSAETVQAQMQNSSGLTESENVKSWTGKGSAETAVPPEEELDDVVQAEASNESSTSDTRSVSLHGDESTHTITLAFSDVTEAEAWLEPRQPLDALHYDVDGSIASRDINTVIREQKAHVTALFNAYFCPISPTPVTTPYDETMRTRWTEWQASHDHRTHWLGHSSFETLYLIEVRMWSVVKEAVNIHRNGYHEGIPIEGGMTCSERLQKVREILSSFQIVRADFIETTPRRINIPYMVAAPTQFAYTKMAAFDFWVRQFSDETDDNVPTEQESQSRHRTGVDTARAESAPPPHMFARRSGEAGSFELGDGDIEVSESAGNESLTNTARPDPSAFWPSEPSAKGPENNDERLQIALSSDHEQPAEQRITPAAETTKYKEADRDQDNEGDEGQEDKEERDGRVHGRRGHQRQRAGSSDQRTSTLLQPPTLPSPLQRGDQQSSSETPLRSLNSKKRRKLRRQREEERRAAGANG